MGCGCKQKAKAVQQSSTTAQSTQTQVQNAIKKTVEKYYEKK